MKIGSKIKVAVLDDYQKVANQMADWSLLDEFATVTIFHTHYSDETILINLLKDFEVLCVMRERTPMTRNLISQLPNLKLIVSTGYRNASIDITAAKEYGIQVKHTGYVWSGAPEHTWALLMSIARNIPRENDAVRKGLWQQSIGIDLAGKTMGIIGLGNIGQKIASYAQAFDMNVIAWSTNLTQDKVEETSIKVVSKEELFRQSDFISLHLVLSNRSINTVQKTDLELMKPTAYIINTSRGPLINENDLINHLQAKKIAGAALDVFDVEPLPEQHPYRRLNNVVITPHIGYVTKDTYQVFYHDTIQHIYDWYKTEL